MCVFVCVLCDASQVMYWNHTMDLSKDVGNVDGTNIKASCAKTAQSFLALEQVQSAWPSIMISSSSFSSCLKSCSCSINLQLSSEVCWLRSDAAVSLAC